MHIWISLITEKEKTPDCPDYYLRSKVSTNLEDLIKFMSPPPPLQNKIKLSLKKVENYISENISLQIRNKYSFISS